MDALIGFIWFGLAWFVMNIAFAKFVGRPMNLGEGVIYPVALVFAVAILIGKFGPSREESLAKDIQKYDHLTEQAKRDDARINLLDECIRHHRASDPDCQRAATNNSNR